MHRTMTISISVILAALGLCGAAMAQSAVTVTEEANGKTIEVPSGQTVTVRLPIQGGTGFGWDVMHARGAKLVSSKVEQKPQSSGGFLMVGGAETQVLLFQPGRAGNADIELGYRRPWMKKTPPAKTFSVHLAVH